MIEYGIPLPEDTAKRGLFKMDMDQYQGYHETKVHTSEDFPYNTFPCTIPLDFTSVPLHWHNTAEIIVVKKGSGIIGLSTPSGR